MVLEKIEHLRQELHRHEHLYYVLDSPVISDSEYANKSVFRLALQSKHERKDLDHTIEVFGRLLKKYGITGNHAH